MNKKEQHPPPTLTIYQAGRLQELIEEIIHCCQERVVFQSKKFALTPAEFRCLILFKSEKYLTVKGIAQKLDVAKSRVTKILEGLLNKRLILRTYDPEDARVVLISLSPTGKKKTEELINFIKEIHHHLLTNLGLEDRKTVLSCLELLRTSMETVKAKML